MEKDGELQSYEMLENEKKGKPKEKLEANMTKIEAKTAKVIDSWRKEGTNKFQAALCLDSVDKEQGSDCFLRFSL